MQKLKPDQKYIMDRNAGLSSAVRYANKRFGKLFPPDSDSKARDVWRRRWTRCFLAKTERNYRNLLAERAKRAKRMEEYYGSK